MGLIRNLWRGYRGGPPALAGRLVDMKTSLKTGSHPANVMAKKDTIWNGEA